jgi:hypothetical protein
VKKRVVIRTPFPSLETVAREMQISKHRLAELIEIADAAAAESERAGGRSAVTKKRKTGLANKRGKSRAIVSAPKAVPAPDKPSRIKRNTVAAHK